jgi:hypothetical protein
MANLLTDTEAVLAASDKTWGDVRWIGSRDGTLTMSVESFRRFADLHYDKGFGAAEVATDLVIVGDGWWMTRGEYDGSEWWDFQTSPVLAPDAKEISGPVVGSYWPSLADLQNPDDEHHAPRSPEAR